MAIGNQTVQNVDETVDRRVMTRMLDLGNVFQLVDDGFNNGAFAKHQTVVQGHQALSHLVLEFGDELNPCGFEQLLGQRSFDIAFVREDFAE
jgi:hypothetical protein